MVGLPAQTFLVLLGLIHSRPRDISVNKADTIHALKEPTFQGEEPSTEQVNRLGKKTIQESNNMTKKSL